MAPHFVLEEMQADFELVLVDRKTNSQHSKEYLSLNPIGRIPTLTEGNTVICESAAICLYLAESDPQSKLVPGIGNPNRPKFLQWLMYLTNTLQAELMIYFYPEKYTAKDKEIIIANQEVRLAQLLSLLDKELVGKSYLVGESITICDYYLFMLAVWADELKKPPLSFGNISKYLKGLAKRDAIINVCKKENLSLKDYE